MDKTKLIDAILGAPTNNTKILILLTEICFDLKELKELMKKVN